MTQNAEIRRIQDALKTLLRDRKISYLRLAEELEVSLPTVKRILSAQDISFERLLQICDVLGLQLQEFLDLARKTDKGLHRLDVEQEKFFAANPSYLAYLLALHDERKTPKQIEKEHRISAVSSARYLDQLTRMGFIRVRPDGGVKILVQGMIGWDDDGMLGRELTSRFIRSISEHVIAGEAQDLFLQLSGRQLSQNEYEMMKHEFGALTEKYRGISKVNSALRDLRGTRAYEVMLIGCRRSPQISLEITELMKTRRVSP